MKTKTFSRLESRTVLEIWYPRYSSQYTDVQERVVLLAKYKVDNAAPWIVIEFTKAKHLLGQHYCISKAEAREHRVENNGSIPCYSVPMSHLQTWEEAWELKETINELWPE